MKSWILQLKQVDSTSPFCVSWCPLDLLNLNFISFPFCEAKWIPWNIQLENYPCFYYREISGWHLHSTIFKFLVPLLGLLVISSVTDFQRKWSVCLSLHFVNFFSFNMKQYFKNLHKFHFTHPWPFIFVFSQDLFSLWKLPLLLNDCT